MTTQWILNVIVIVAICWVVQATENSTSNEVPLLKMDLISNYESLLQSREYARLKRYFVLNRLKYDRRVKVKRSWPPTRALSGGKSRFTVARNIERPLMHGVLVSPSRMIWESSEPTIAPIMKKRGNPGLKRVRIVLESRDTIPPGKRRIKGRPTQQLYRMNQMRGISRRENVAEPGEMDRHAQPLLTTKRRSSGWSGGPKRYRKIKNKTIWRKKPFPKKQLVEPASLPPPPPPTDREARKIRPRYILPAFRKPEVPVAGIPDYCLKCYLYWINRLELVPGSSIFDVCCKQADNHPVNPHFTRSYSRPKFN